MNFIPGALVEEGGAPRFLSTSGQVQLDVPRPARFGQATLGIRCEHIHEDPRGPIVGSVLTEEYLGNASNVHLDTVVGPLIMRTDSVSKGPRGANLRLRLDPAQISLFDATTEERL
jgi:ABC-type sugar transport system ATPase subunit